MAMKRKAYSSSFSSRRAKRARRSFFAALPSSSYPSLKKGAEVKYVDTSITPTTTAATYVVDGLNNIPQGTGQGERVGNKIIVLGIDLFGYAGVNWASLSNYIIQTWDGTNPTATYFQSAGGFPILEKCKALHMQMGGVGTQSGLLIKKTMRFKNPIVCRYSGSGSTTCTFNKLNFVMFNPSANGSELLKVRLYYLDD